MSPPEAERGAARASLSRELGPLAATLITVGAMIGTGVFTTPPSVASAAGSTPVALAMWALGGALSLLGALSFAELGAAIPETGGLYVYLRRAFGHRTAFVFGWAMLAVMVPSSTGFFASVAVQPLATIFGLGATGQALAACGVIAVLTATNLRGVRAGAFVQGAITAVKYGGVVLVAVAGAWAPATHVVRAAAPRAGASALLAALVPVLWAYDGWVEVTSVAGEVRDPQRTLPRAVVGGAALVTALYLAVNWGYLHALGAGALSASDSPAGDVASSVMGPPGRAVAGALVAVSTLGGCAVSLLTGSRVVYAMARDGAFVNAFARTSSRGVPHVAVIACSALACAYLGSALGKLGDVFVVGAWPFYALGACATIVLRRREPALPRPHRTVGYPFTIVVFASASLAIVAGYALTEPVHTGVSLGLIALGVPIEWAGRALSRRANRVAEPRSDSERPA